MKRNSQYVKNDLQRISDLQMEMIRSICNWSIYQ